MLFLVIFIFKIIENSILQILYNSIRSKFRTNVGNISY